MDTVMNFERATMQWLVHGYQRRTLRRGVHEAYLTFARTYPNWVAALFDEHFINTHLLPQLHNATQGGDKVTARQVAELWARQVSMLPSLRQKHIARVVPVAAHFLCMVADELAAMQVDATTNMLVETAVG